jgi:hypothetical protein
MNSSRVGVYKLTDGSAQEVVRRAEAGMLPILREQPGFVAYELITTGPSSLVSISTWRNHDEADAAVKTIGGWVKEHMAELTLSVENHVGDVAFRHLAARS